MANAHASIYICTSLCLREYNDLGSFRRHLALNHNGTLAEFEAGTIGPVGSWLCDLCPDAGFVNWERHHSEEHFVGLVYGYSAGQVKAWKRIHLTFVPDHGPALRAAEQEDRENEAAENEEATSEEDGSQNAQTEDTENEEASEAENDDDSGDDGDTETDS